MLIEFQIRNLHEFTVMHKGHKAKMCIIIYDINTFVR